MTGGESLSPGAGTGEACARTKRGRPAAAARAPMRTARRDSMATLLERTLESTADPSQRSRELPAFLQASKLPWRWHAEASPTSCSTCMRWPSEGAVEHQPLVRCQLVQHAAREEGLRSTQNMRK